jgi:hypothetical protein
MDPIRPASFRRAFAALLLFGTAFGYLEAAVVSYLRDLHEPARQQFHPGRPAGDLFPLLTLEQIRASGVVQGKTLAIEIGREAATILMLAGIALAVARNAAEWAAALGIAFGVWDITFYVFLKLLLDWPASLMTWDILFLLPVPWTGPVLAPVLVSVAMIASGVFHLWRAWQGAPVRIGAFQWLGITAGAAVIFAAFIMDYPTIMAAGMPHPFHWSIFGAGLTLGVMSYASSVLRVTAPRADTAAAAAGPAPAEPSR